ncbi:MAG: glycosyltransferase [Thermoanaerobaculales bacterium]|jgi:glycosyltransferase involved in cell wall biosynthesis|nr:glycosyltransferase [Thermoanaerobaculales bacterium]
MTALPPILHFNTHAAGGAAIAARKIHDSLVAHGLDSRYHFVDGHTDEPTYTKLGLHWRYGLVGRLVNSVVQRARTRMGVDPTGKREPFGWSTMPGRLVALPPIDPKAIIHLHWVVGLVDYRRFFAALPASAPIVWTLHDMNPMTGGCHYAWNCTGFTGRCTDCPQLRWPARSSVARNAQGLRAHALAHRNLHVVANSNWNERQARQSRVFDAARSFRTICLAVDVQVFRPGDRAAAKRALGLSESKSAVGFGASRLDAPRKGFADLCAALSLLRNTEELELVTFGDHGRAEAPDGIEWRDMGSVSCSRRLATIYNAIDVFVMPSQQEAVGQTALEALACGTPVVAFDVGGVPEFVLPDNTGRLVEQGNTEDLAGTIAAVLWDSSLRRRLGENGRKLIEAKYSPDRQRNQYAALYQHLAASL